MGRIRSAAALFAALLLAGCQTPELATASLPRDAAPTRVSAPRAAVPMQPSTAMADGVSVPPPAGFAAFCRRDPGQCDVPAGAPATIVLSPSLWQTLEQVNTAWNGAIKPLDDSAHYGVVDYWTIPTDGYGDCEDYALAKRKSLIALGLSPAALRIAVARTKDGAAHAILAVETDRGDYVLDNLSDAVLPWTAVQYGWVARQVPDQTHWAAIGPDGSDEKNIATADIMPR